ncbi:MAG: gamma-mobile-trio protein GmtX [Solirubrobacteraceae bacterium]
MGVDPTVLLEELKARATGRKRATLDLIYGLLEKQAKSGVVDFSIATLGRLSTTAGGPSTQAIRNKNGADYRRLIEAYAASQGTTTKKPLSPTNRQHLPTRDEDLLKRIEEPALRAVIGSIIAERNRYLSENRILKAQAEIVVDCRPAQHEVSSAEVLPALGGLLTPMEREALEAAISEAFLTQKGWTPTANGRIKDEDGRTLYKPGYVSAIEKVLKETRDGR